MLTSLEKLAVKWRIRPKGVLHIGAHTGQEAPHYRAIGCERMIFIEALAHIFAQLEINLQKYPQATAIKACISDTDGEEVVFKITSNEGQSSSFLELGVHKIEHPDVTVVAEEVLTTTRIDTLFDDVPLECDLLNIDLQGAELLALRGMGNLLEDFKWVYIEVNKKHVYVGCPLIEEIDEYLKQFGFHRVETWWAGTTSWGDALYVK
jgi:FkbM family methyltransferase